MTIDRVKLSKVSKSSQQLLPLGLLRHRVSGILFSILQTDNNPGLFPVVSKGSVLQRLAVVQDCRNTLPLRSIKVFSFLTGFTEDEGAEHLAGCCQAESWCCISVNESKIGALPSGG